MGVTWAFFQSYGKVSQSNDCNGIAINLPASTNWPETYLLLCMFIILSGVEPVGSFPGMEVIS